MQEWTFEFVDRFKVKKNPKRYIYGLDISMSNTGVTIIDEETHKVVYIGSIGTNVSKFNKLPIEYKHGKRLRHHFNEINKLIKKYPPSVAVIERGFSRFNNATQILFRVHGVYGMAFSEVPNYYYPPTDVKKTIYKGNASKEELANVISKRMKLKFKNEDESDSTAVALTYLINECGMEWKSVKALTEKDIITREKKESKKTKK